MDGAFEDGSSSLSRPGRRRTAWPFARFYPNSARDEGSLDLADQFLDCDGLREPAPDTRVQRLFLGRLMAADDDDRHLGHAVGRELVQHLAAVHERHDPVEEDDIRALARDPIDCLGAIRSKFDLKTTLIQSDRVETPNVRVVLDNEDLLLAAHRLPICAGFMRRRLQSRPCEPVGTNTSWALRI